MMFDLSGLYGKGTAIKGKMINHSDERRNGYEKVGAEKTVLFR